MNETRRRRKPRASVAKTLRVSLPPELDAAVAGFVGALGDVLPVPLSRSEALLLLVQLGLERERRKREMRRPQADDDDDATSIP